MRKQVAAGAALRELLASAPPPMSNAAADRLQQLLAVARAGLARLQQERDVNRLLLRDLAAFPDLLFLVRESELRAVHAGLAAWLRTKPTAGQPDVDALAAVLMGAVSHYWIMTDVFSGEHPLGVEEDRYLETLVEMAKGLLRTA